MMLMLFAAAQIHRLEVGILGMEASGIFVERAALAEIDDVEHGMAAADDIEGGIEDVCRNGHVVSLLWIAIPGQPAGLNPESIFPVAWIPGSTLCVAPE